MTRVTEASVRSMLRADTANHRDRGDEAVLLLMRDEHRREDSPVVKSSKHLAKVRRFIEEL